MSDPKKLAVITGASSGIGWEYALQLALERNYNVIVIARRTERLESLKATILSRSTELGISPNEIAQVHCLPGDLTRPEERIRLLTQIDKLGQNVDLLVNNAGFGTVCYVEQSPPERQVEMVELNCLAPVHFTCHFLPKMYQRHSGSIINLCSVAGFQPMPCMATYAATKSFLLNFTVAVSVEAERHGVHLLAHCPGPTESEFHIASGLPEKINIIRAQGTSEVVREALAGLDRRRLVVVNGRLNRLLSFLPRALSLRTSARIIRGMLHEHAAPPKVVGKSS